MSKGHKKQNSNTSDTITDPTPNPSTSPSHSRPGKSIVQVYLDGFKNIIVSTVSTTSYIVTSILNKSINFTLSTYNTLAAYIKANPQTTYNTILFTTAAVIASTIYREDKDQTFNRRLLRYDLPITNKFENIYAPLAATFATLFGLGNYYLKDK